jgi:hypothetical protein
LTTKNRIVLIVLGLHLAFVILCFGAAIMNPERSGLAPIIIATVDIPAYYLIDLVRPFAHTLAPESYAWRLIVDGFLFSLIGSLWWFFVVNVLNRVFNRIREQF